jgi:hypothetical protein
VDDFDDFVTCADCGGDLEAVRPGKHQHPGNYEAVCLELKETRRARDAYSELAAGKCTTQKVIDELGPLSLWSQQGINSLLEKKEKEHSEAIERLTALAYFYPPNEPFAPDGTTWKQMYEEAQAQLKERERDAERLRPYISHRRLCDKNSCAPTGTRSAEAMAKWVLMQPCTCGLDAALKETP